MKKNIILPGFFATLLAALCFVSATVWGTEVDDSEALKGVKEGRVIFDTFVAEENRFIRYLSVLKETHAGLVKQGVKPSMIITMRGPAVLFVSKKHADKEDLGIIEKRIKELKELGVQFELCSIAARLLNVDYNDILSDVKIIGNGFISLIGYQSKGYAVISLQ